MTAVLIRLLVFGINRYRLVYCHKLYLGGGVSVPVIIGLDEVVSLEKEWKFLC